MQQLKKLHRKPTFNSYLIKQFDLNKEEIEWEEFKLKYEYNDIDSKYRIKVFDIERNDADIAKIYERVEECRTYIKTLI